MKQRDPGLQPERTALAWTRTGLAAAAVSLLLMRAAWHTSNPYLVTAAALAFQRLALRRRRELLRALEAPPAWMTLATAALLLSSAVVAGWALCEA